MADTIGREQVRKRIDAGTAVVVEALPPSYHRDRHLPGALNLPHDQVDALAPGLIPDKDSEVIVYCADQACPNSHLAAQRLEELGYTNVSTYADGKADWVGAGLPTESGA